MSLKSLGNLPLVKMSKPLNAQKKEAFLENPSNILNESATGIESVTSFTNIINCSFATSTFPDDMKLAEVIPLLKDGDHEVASNNRPLFLLNTVSKICERAVLNQFNSYLTRNKQLSVRTPWFHLDSKYRLALSSCTTYVLDSSSLTEANLLW